MSLSHGRTIFMIMLLACQLLISSCSKRVHPGAPAAIISSPADRKELNEFMDAGVEKPVETRSVNPDEIIITASQYLGVPHCMGGTTSKCMDCSGLIFRVFATHGIELPHSSEEQARYGKIIAERENLQKGDIVFFIRTYSTSRFITHSGIYIGDGRFIHTSSSKGVITTALDDPWWSERYLFATRMFE